MPVITIEAPPELRLERKKKMIEKLTAAMDEAYEIGDTVSCFTKTRRKTRG